MTWLLLGVVLWSGVHFLPSAELALRLHRYLFGVSPMPR